MNGSRGSLGNDLGLRLRSWLLVVRQEASTVVGAGVGDVRWRDSGSPDSVNVAGAHTRGSIFNITEPAIAGGPDIMGFRDSTSRSPWCIHPVQLTEQVPSYEGTMSEHWEKSANTILTTVLNNEQMMFEA